MDEYRSHDVINLVVCGFGGAFHVVPLFWGTSMCPDITVCHWEFLRSMGRAYWGWGRGYWAYGEDFD